MNARYIRSRAIGAEAAQHPGPAVTNSVVVDGPLDAGRRSLGPDRERSLVVNGAHHGDGDDPTGCPLVGGDGHLRSAGHAVPWRRQRRAAALCAACCAGPGRVHGCRDGDVRSVGDASAAAPWRPRNTNSNTNAHDRGTMMIIAAVTVASFVGPVASWRVVLFRRHRTGTGCAPTRRSIPASLLISTMVTSSFRADRHGDVVHPGRSKTPSRRPRPTMAPSVQGDRDAAGRPPSWPAAGRAARRSPE